MPASSPHYINNKWLPGSGLPVISRNPATEETLWEGQSATFTEVDAAVSAANAAAASWASLPLNKRIAYLEHFRDELKANLPSLSLVISKEVGKPLWESKTEVQAMINKVAISIDAYNQRCAEVKRGSAITRFKPHGVLAVFGPFNFPGHLPNGHIIPALLAGNTVVFKPSEMTPLVAEQMMLYWEKCGLPPGVLNMVQGGRDTGALLANHSGLNGLCFTGSYETGVIFSEEYAKHPEKILALELGGNNPLVISEVTNVDAAVLATIQSAYLTSGQRCSCARRLIVIENKQTEPYIDALVKAIKKIKVGSYTDSPEPFMGPVISEKSAQHILAIHDAYHEQGGIAFCQMQLIKVDSALITPALMDVTNIKKFPDQEVFGPFLRLKRVPDLSAAIEEANNTAYGLTAGIFSKSEEEYRRFYNEVKAGVINWNTPLTGASSEAPFGGIGKSGNHRPSGYFATDYCSYPVASMESSELIMPSSLPPGLS